MYDVLIVGGGVAGASAAIRLAKRGWTIALLEKRSYPAHKLCGEFLSPEVASSFEQLGALGAIREAGAHPIRQVRVTTTGGATFQSALPGTALGISRYRLDALLFQQAQNVGVEAHDGVTVRDLAGGMDEGFVAETTDGHVEARVVLGAYGKRSALDRRLGRTFLQKQSPFVAFKAHYHGIDLGSVIELHAFPGGYCGVSHVEEEHVNVCWIAHERMLKKAGGNPENMTGRVLSQNPALEARLDAMERITDPFLAAGQLLFAPKQAFDGDVCMIGDTAGMIAPMCGDGMAMALRSAEVAAPLMDAHLRGCLSASSFRQQYTNTWQREFRGRMRLGRWLHHGYVHPAAAQVGVKLCDAVPLLGRWLIRATRG